MSTLHYPACRLACNKSSKLLTRQDPDKQEAKVESVKERAETHRCGSRFLSLTHVLVVTTEYSGTC